MLAATIAALLLAVMLGNKKVEDVDTSFYELHRNQENVHHNLELFSVLVTGRMMRNVSSLYFLWYLCCVYILVANAYMAPVDKGWRCQQPHTRLHGKITPRENEGMDDYRRAVVNTLNANKSDGSFGGREILELLVKKWGVGVFIFVHFCSPIAFSVFPVPLTTYISHT